MTSRKAGARQRFAPLHAEVWDQLRVEPPGHGQDRGFIGKGFFQTGFETELMCERRELRRIGIALQPAQLRENVGRNARTE